VKSQKFYVLKTKLSDIIGEEAIKEKWEQVEANLNNLNKTDFLINFTSLFNGKTTGDKTLDALDSNGKLKDEKSAIQTLKELVEVSKYYLYLVESHNFLKEITTQSSQEQQKEIKNITEIFCNNEETKKKLSAFYPDLAKEILNYWKVEEKKLEVSEIIKRIKDLMLSDEIVKETSKIRAFHSTNDTIQLNIF